jgi:uncharacterized protein (TIRG00374 family)
VHKRALASLIIGIAISLVGLWYAFTGVDLAAMASSMAHVNTAWLAASVGCSLLSLVVRAIRWRFLLAGVKPVPLGSLVSATFIGIMANNLLPARLGEVVRAWVLGRREAASVAAVLGTVFVERLLDVLTAVGILGLCLAVSPDLATGAGSLLRRSGLMVLGFAAVGGTGLVCAIWFRWRLLRATEQWGARVGHTWVLRGVELCHRFLEGLCGLRSGAGTAAVAILSVLVWAVAIAAFALLAEGLDLGLTLVQTSLVFVIVLFGVAIPSAPGFVGTFHGFCVAGLALVAGTEPTLAATYATLLHASQWLSINLVGIGFLLTDRSLTWAGLTGLSKQHE